MPAACINNGNEIFIIDLIRPCISTFSVHYIYYIVCGGDEVRCPGGEGRGLTMLKRNAHKSIKLWSSAYKRTSPALCPGRQLLSFHRRDFVFIYHHRLQPPPPPPPPPLSLRCHTATLSPWGNV